MVADQLDYVIGVDPYRDQHAVGVVEVRSGVVVFEACVAADSGGYADALRLAEICGGAAGVRGRGHRLLRGRPDPFPDRQRRAGVRGRPSAPRAPLGRQDRCARRCPGRPECAQPGAARDTAQQGRTRGATGADGRPRRGGQRETGRPLPAPCSPRHDTRAAEVRAAAAGPSTSPRASREHATGPTAGHRVAWRPARGRSRKSTERCSTTIRSFSARQWARTTRRRRARSPT